MQQHKIGTERFDCGTASKSRNRWLWLMDQYGKRKTTLTEWYKKERLKFPMAQFGVCEETVARVSRARLLVRISINQHARVPS